MNDIIIDKAILHILDTSIDTPVLADKLMNFSSQADEFLKTHILRAMDDGDIKKGVFRRSGTADTTDSQPPSILTTISSKSHQGQPQMRWF